MKLNLFFYLITNMLPKKTNNRAKTHLNGIKLS